MVEERHCSPEVAKLLKAKGFEIPTFTFYDDEGKFNRANTVCNWNSSLNGTSFNTISCPTHQMALDWLDKQEIHICIMYDVIKDGYYANIISYDIIRLGMAHHNDRIKCYSTKYELIEVALKYSLENLI